MPRRNRVDPWGDLNAVADRGLFTGNRGCLVNDDRQLARHHRGSLWIICLLEYRGWHHELDAPSVWTPVFFLDEAVALAAGHRPCGLCRRDAYLAYRSAVAASAPHSLDGSTPQATTLNRSLQRERLHRLDRRGRGRGPFLERYADRILLSMPIGEVPTGAVVLGGDDKPHLVIDGGLQRFSFAGWQEPVPSPDAGSVVAVLTPATSLAALHHGYRPRLHPSAAVAEPTTGPLGEAPDAVAV
ncbi:MAG: hypothetical protein AAF467_19245 [Actinomycetota bacterium]